MKTNRSFIYTATLACAMLLTAGTSVAGYKVTVSTTECNGDTGFASIDVEDFYKIETTDCAPEKPNVKLKQVLVRSANGFDVFNVTPEAAAQLQKEIQLYMDARRKALERGGTVILEK